MWIISRLLVKADAAAQAAGPVCRNATTKRLRTMIPLGLSCSIKPGDYAPIPNPSPTPVCPDLTVEPHGLDSGHQRRLQSNISHRPLGKGHVGRAGDEVRGDRGHARDGTRDLVCSPKSTDTQ